MLNLKKVDKLKEIRSDKLMVVAGERARVNLHHNKALKILSYCADSASKTFCIFQLPLEEKSPFDNVAVELGSRTRIASLQLTQCHIQSLKVKLIPKRMNTV